MNIISSPCIKNCNYDSNYIYCTDCFRTSREISNWIYFSEDRRIEIMKSLSKRKRTLITNNDK